MLIFVVAVYTVGSVLLLTEPETMAPLASPTSQ